MPVGLFGPVEITESATKRALLINGQVQGEAYLHPGAEIVSKDIVGPGPVHTCAYMNGWFAAGVMNPTGSGLMVGLGAGQGVISLLHNFPGIDLTVVEIDPVVVDLAIKAFPLLGYYLNRGVLNIEISDAVEYLNKSQDKWDFGLGDAYTGGNALIDTCIPALCVRADNVYVNCIDTYLGDSMSRVLTKMNESGKTARAGWRAVRYDWPVSPHSIANWILTSQGPDHSKLDAWEPYESLADDAAADARRSWSYFLSSELTRRT